MKAMVLREYGNQAGFQLAELTQPTVKAGHVLVRVAATSVNAGDTMIRQMGKDLTLSPDLPAVLGMDVSRPSWLTSAPHPDALDARKSREVMRGIDAVLHRVTHPGDDPQGGR